MRSVVTLTSTIVVLAGLMLGMRILIHTPSASAEVFDCSSAESHYFAGYYQAGYSDRYEGAYGVIPTNYGAVCDTNTTSCASGASACNFTAEWTMIAGDESGLDSGWVQSGYVRWYNSSIYNFAQANDGAGDVYTRYPARLSIGSSYTYKQHYYASCGCIESYRDDTVLLTTPWNPFDYWNEFSVQFLGEAAYLESDIPGNASSPTIFSSLQGEDQSDDTFSNIPPNYLTHRNDGNKTREDGESWYAKLVGSGPEFENYTDTARQ